MNKYRMTARLRIHDLMEAGNLQKVEVSDPNALTGQMPEGAERKQAAVRLECKGPPPGPGQQALPPAEEVELILEFDAPTISNAFDWGRGEIEARADVLSAITLNRIDVAGARSCVEITPGRTEGLEASFIAEEIAPEAVGIENEVLRHVMGGTAFEGKLTPKILGSFRWFRRGVSAELPEDMFLSFWIGLEMVAGEFTEGTTKFMFCPRCQKSIETCPECGETTEMRAQASDGIVTLFQEHMGLEKSDFRRINTTRAKLFHGNKSVNEAFRLELLNGAVLLRRALVRAYEVLLQMTPGSHPFGARLDLPLPYSARLNLIFKLGEDPEEEGQEIEES